ncbi:TonB-dependent receptor [Parapedobacter koreensis]|uniref:Iron complex outermembrane recepter protein n=1 Tax=Parapedobacter koreensis TaxID=332977 RepID=A0A1H7GDQ4_9SPHI|nr:TonB-dependent receptor [Parapedobacter koreensis]SEK33935.1 iron complex outermembrane recepter protein [Parapedobacter koreensis]
MIVYKSFHWHNIGVFLFFAGFYLAGLPSGLAQHAQLQGKVTDRAHEAISNATVQLLNSNLATSTDEQGNFVFEQVSHGTHILRVSALGYATENHTILVDGDAAAAIQLTNMENRLDEAIVTAHKMESDPHDIPASLSVVSAKEVEQQYIWNIMDATAVIPNLNIANPGDNRNVASIRGITTTSYNQAVATYVDGVNQFGLDTYIPYLQDVERIEVLRGPQGTLYGRNAMAGVINIITKQPTNNVSGLAEVNFGNHGQQRYLLGVRTPVVKDKLFFGASGMFNGLDGFYTNDFDGSHYDKQHTVFGNYYLKYLLNTQWAMTLNFKHVSNRNGGAFSLIMGMDDAFGNPFHLNQNAKTTMADESRNVSLAINHFGNALNFSSQTAFQSNYRYYQDPIDGDFSPLDAISIVNDYGKNWNNVKVFTQEFKVSSAPSKDALINWTAGAFLFHQDAPTKQGTYFGADAGMMGEGTPTYATSILTNSATNQGAAIFGQIGFRFEGGWELQAGLRYDYEHAQLNALGEFQPDGGDVMVVQPDTAASANFNALTPSVSVKYAFDATHHIYGSYARGFRAGGISQLSSDPSEASLRPFDPEYSNNIEVGSKNVLLDQRLQLNLAVFYSRVNDAQVPTLVLPDAITVTQNTGRMESMGGELEATARVARHLSLWGNVAFTHARYLDLNTVGEGGNVQLEGNRPVFTPDWTAFLGGQYTIPLAKRQQFQVGVYGKFVGQQYFTVENTLGQAAYSLLNVNIGYSLLGYEIIFWGQNLADKRYIDYAYDFGFAAVHMGRPATYGLTLRKRFG